ncbi:MAG: hypothetical protein WBK67_03225 [Minisyncoccales bacterium]
MNRILKIENYKKGKRKRELFIDLSQIESILNQADEVARSLTTLLSDKKRDGSLDEMTELLSRDEKERLVGLFREVEFKIRLARDYIL